MVTASWSIGCICVTMRQQDRVGKDARMDAEAGVTGWYRKALLG